MEAPLPLPLTPVEQQPILDVPDEHRELLAEVVTQYLETPTSEGFQLPSALWVYTLECLEKLFEGFIPFSTVEPIWKRLVQDIYLIGSRIMWSVLHVTGTPVSRRKLDATVIPVMVKEGIQLRMEDLPILLQDLLYCKWRMGTLTKGEMMVPDSQNNPHDTTYWSSFVDMGQKTWFADARAPMYEYAPLWKLHLEAEGNPSPFLPNLLHSTILVREWCWVTEDVHLLVEISAHSNRQRSGTLFFLQPGCSPIPVFRNLNMTLRLCPEHQLLPSSLRGCVGDEGWRRSFTDFRNRVLYDRGYCFDVVTSLKYGKYLTITRERKRKREIPRSPLKFPSLRDI